MKSVDKNKIIALILLILGVSIVFEIVRNDWTLYLFILGMLGLGVFNRLIPSQSRLITTISLILVGITMLQTISAWLFTVIIIIILFSQNQQLFHSVKQAIFESDYSRIGSEFVSIRLDKYQDKPAKRTRYQWFGRYRDENEIYEWDDINYTKLAGDTVIDIGNTIIPKDQNIILIRKAFGNTKILIPEEVAISLDFSVFLGRVHIGEDELVLNNEVITFRSDRYDESSRKLKIVTNILLGDIEVVFL